MSYQSVSNSSTGYPQAYNVEPYNETDNLLSKREFIYDASLDEPYRANKSTLHCGVFQTKATTLIIKIVLVIFFISILAIYWLSSYRRSVTNGSHIRQHQRRNPLMEFSISVHPYSEVSSLSYLPWDAIIEPYRINTASMTTVTFNGKVYSFNSAVTKNKNTNLAVKTATNDLIVIWHINGVEHIGSSVFFQVNATGKIPFSITVKDKSYGLSLTRQFHVVGKYVRREIRTLTNNDRNTVLSALQTMYTVPARIGALKYGDNYRSGDQLVYKHLTAAGTTDCDHWHDGAGIVTNHAAFTLEAEQSIQAINPALAMPYWEYPKDAYYYTDSNWGNSPLFDDDWFGTSSPTNDHYELLSGRFSTVSVSKAEDVLLQAENGASGWDHVKVATTSLNPYVNAYGALRSPWNNNPATHISRHNMTYGAFSKLGRPGCASMSSCYASNSLAEMNDCLNGYTHGPVHIIIGGSWNEGDLFDSNQKINLRFLQKASKMLLFKMLWRYGWARCPTSCEVSSDGRRLQTVHRPGTNTPSPSLNQASRQDPAQGPGQASRQDPGLSQGPGNAQPNMPINGKFPAETPRPTVSPDVNAGSAEDVPEDANDFNSNPIDNLPTVDGCSCHVPKEYIEEYGLEYILTSSGVLEALKKDLSFIPTFPDMNVFYFALLKAIQDPGIVGDMLTSAAPQDPIFWPLHGSIERLLGLKRIALAMNLIDDDDFDMSWGYKTDNLLYLRGVCDWSNVSSQDDLTLPTCNMGENVICEGHGSDDVLHFENLLGDGQTFTNKEMLEILHPWNEGLPYTYDSFDYDYCYDMYPDSRTGAVEQGSQSGRFTFHSLKYPDAAVSTVSVQVPVANSISAMG